MESSAQGEIRAVREGVMYQIWTLIGIMVFTWAVAIWSTNSEGKA
jgi:hypothetical protein